MNALTAALKEELNVEMVSIGGLQIPESVVVSWGIMAFLVIGSILLTRNLKVDHITKRQAILETVVTFINDFFVGLLGEKRQAVCALPHLGGALHRLLQPHRRVWHQAPHKGPECHRRPGLNEHLPHRVFRASTHAAASASSRA